MTEKTNKTPSETKSIVNSYNVYQKLQCARVELQKMNIKKSGENKYSGFKYFELKDFIPLLNEILFRYGLTTNFSIAEEQAKLTVINVDKPEENILFTSPIAEAQLKGCTPIQAVGAVHTYMKRYLYLNALEIVEDDILDKNAGAIEEKKGNNKYSPKIVLFNKLKAKQLTNDEMNAFCRHFGIDGSDETSIQNFIKKGDVDKFIDEFKNLEVANAG